MTPSAKRSRLIFWCALIGLCVLLGALAHFVHLRTIHQWGTSINGWLLFLLMALPPLVGAPMSILTVMAGAKYGPWGGIALTGGVVAIHLMASWWLARHWLRKPVELLLNKTQYKMPRVRKGEYVGVCLLAALLPGPSYALKNYFLVLSNLPFKIVLLVGLPAHLFALSPGIMFGDFTGAMTVPKVVFLVVYVLTVIGTSHWLIRRLRTRKTQTTRADQ
jgi:uncharacterized membrane protein YdjX (TVP38/TMEM64 family)